ncbi:MAG: methyltransferase [Acidiferrobacteraceae bacterium]
MLERLLISVGVFIAGYLMFIALKRRQLHNAQSAASNVRAATEYPTILCFSASSCHQCHGLQRPQLEEVQKELLAEQPNGGLRLVIYSVEENPDVAKQWGIRTVPTTIIIDANGKVLHINNGLTSKAQLLRQLTNVLKFPEPASSRGVHMKKEKKQTDKRDTAGIVAPPPVIYLGALGVGYYFSHIYPLNPIPTAVKMLGWPLIALGVLCWTSAFRMMRRANTPVNPYKPSTALVTAGPYGLSRNPLYVAAALVYVGIALLLNALWAIVLLPLVLIVMTCGVIAREERLLERKFGAAYQEYKARVRRWI